MTMKPRIIIVTLITIALLGAGMLLIFRRDKSKNQYDILAISTEWVKIQSPLDTACASLRASIIGGTDTTFGLGIILEIAPAKGNLYQGPHPLGVDGLSDTIRRIEIGVRDHMQGITWLPDSAFRRQDFSCVKLIHLPSPDMQTKHVSFSPFCSVSNPQQLMTKLNHADGIPLVFEYKERSSIEVFFWPKASFFTGLGSKEIAVRMLLSSGRIISN